MRGLFIGENVKEDFKSKRKFLIKIQNLGLILWEKVWV